jgi:hypothetical protein
MSAIPPVSEHQRTELEHRESLLRPLWRQPSALSTKPQLTTRPRESKNKGKVDVDWFVKRSSHIADHYMLVLRMSDERALSTTVGLYKIDHTCRVPQVTPLGTNRLHQNLFNYAVSPATFQSANSEKVEDMTSMLGKLALVIAAAGGLSLAVLSPAPVEAGVIHRSLGLAVASGDSDVVQVRCDRRLSNLWSCNDDVRVRNRRDVRRDVQGRDSYAYHPCDHSYQTAMDGSRCGNRAADKKRGGR